MIQQNDGGDAESVPAWLSRKVGAGRAPSPDIGKADTELRLLHVVVVKVGLVYVALVTELGVQNLG